VSVGALFNIVRVTPFAVEDDARLSNVVRIAYDGVELVSPDGEPCAIPAQITSNDFDKKYTYIDGNMGSVTQQIRHDLSFNIDWIDSEKWNKLARWKHARARVRIVPGFGQLSSVGWRPLLISGGTSLASGRTAYDLTNRYSLTHQDSGAVLLWDSSRKILVGPVPTSGDSLPIDTPGGSGMVTARTTQNRWNPSYPKSATAGVGGTDAGWEKWGADAADITFEHVANGFGNNACPHVLRVRTSTLIASSRAIGSQNAFDSTHADFQGYEFLGYGRARLTVWLKGRFGGGAKLMLGAMAGGSDEYDLSNVHLQDWTPITVTHYESAWSTAGPAYVKIEMPGSSPGDKYDFLVGPTMLEQASATYYFHADHWCDYSSGSTGDIHETINNYRFPPAGTVTIAFFVPEGLEQVNGARYGLMGQSYRSMAVYYSSGWMFYMQTGTAWLSGDWTPRPGKINVVSFSWDGHSMRLIANGSNIYESSSIGVGISIGDNTAPLYIGSDYAGYHSSPISILSLRVDDSWLDEDTVKSLHAQLMDPASVAVAVLCRGREFIIDALPAVPRPAVDGTQWLGTLSLKQVKYDSDFADAMSKEVSDSV